MATSSNVVPLNGSERTIVPGSKVIGPVHPDERVEVTVRLRPRAPISAAAWAEATAAPPIKNRKYLTREQLARQHGAVAR